MTSQKYPGQADANVARPVWVDCLAAESSCRGLTGRFCSLTNGIWPDGLRRWTRDSLPLGVDATWLGREFCRSDGPKGAAIVQSVPVNAQDRLDRAYFPISPPAEQEDVRHLVGDFHDLD